MRAAWVGYFNGGEMVSFNLKNSRILHPQQQPRSHAGGWIHVHGLRKRRPGPWGSGSIHHSRRRWPFAASDSCKFCNMTVTGLSTDLYAPEQTLRPLCMDLAGYNMTRQFSSTQSPSIQGMRKPTFATGSSIMPSMHLVTRDRRSFSSWTFSTRPNRP